MKGLLILLFFVVFSVNSRGQSCVVKIHTDNPYLLKGQKLNQLVYISSDSFLNGRMCTQTYLHLENGDSVCVLYHVSKKLKIKSGINKIKVCFVPQDTIKEYSDAFYEIIKRTNNLPPGIYTTTVTFYDTINKNVYCRYFFQKIDSNLQSGSQLRYDINKSLLPSSGIFSGFTKKIEKVSGYASGKAIKKSDKKINSLTKSRGLTSLQYEKRGKSYIDFFYESWFAGRYEVDQNKPLKKQLLQEDHFSEASNMNILASNDLDVHPSLFSQYKNIKKQRDDNAEVKGELSVSGTTANSQEPNSGIDNNYIETRGRIELPLLNLPFEIEGLYTTQDAGRKIKTSYVHFHYDVDKVKDEMMKFISSYNQKFAETKSKGLGMQQVYASAIASLEQQKMKLESDAKQQIENKNNELAKNKSLVSKNETIIDTARIDNKTTNEVSDILQENKQHVMLEKGKIEERARKIEVLSQKIEHYKALLEQNRNTNYFDSAIGYSKTQEINQKDISYKQLAKKSSELLPDGSIKKFATGLISFDAGMFSKNTSKYTMSGQMIKGVDLGYDLGFCEAGFMVGKTEYIGRDGSLDKYTCYSTKVSFKLFDEQKLSLIYYGYSADRKLYSGDAFFKNMDIGSPTFLKPVHIMSLNYTGAISKYVAFSTDLASTIKTTNSSVSLIDKSGIHFDVDGTIPVLPVQAQFSFDKTGKEFENNTLPVTLKGTEQYKLSTTAELFHGFLTTGVEFNYLTQSSFTYSGNNTKWGFMIRTHSKRYPAISISYKPYSTFRTFSDTFNVPQRPMFGSVFTSKASYQFKRKDYSLRFSLVYNKSNTVMDTTFYGNTLLQGMCTYSDKIYSSTLIFGYTEQTGSVAPTNFPTSMSFVNVSGSYSFNKKIIINGGVETGMTFWGLSRFAINSGLQFSSAKKPVSIRLNLRGGEYKLKQYDNWAPLYNGYLELTYKFKTKKNRKNNYHA